MGQTSERTGVDPEHPVNGVARQQNGWGLLAERLEKEHKKAAQ
jgi:hypothetical protein